MFNSRQRNGSKLYNKKFITLIILSIAAIFLTLTISRSIIVSNIESNTPLPQTTPAVLMFGWSTISSNNCFISFQYPSDWQASGGDDNNTNQCHFELTSPEDKAQQDVSFTLDTVGLSWEENVKLPENAGATPFPIPTADDGIRNERTDRYGTTTIYNYWVNFHKREKVYLAQYSTAINDDPRKEAIIKQIFSTITFTGSEHDYKTPFNPVLH